MKIAIIGAGNVGGNLGKLWALKGHTIFWGVRDFQKYQHLLEATGDKAQLMNVQDAIEAGEVVVIATPWDTVLGVLAVGKSWKDKIVVDATNRFKVFPDSAPSGAEDIAHQIPDAKIVKAFNSIGAEQLENPQFGSEKATMFICGTDIVARDTVAHLVKQLGFEVVDAGDLSAAKHIENLAKFWIYLSRSTTGRNVAFKLLKR